MNRSIPHPRRRSGTRLGLMVLLATLASGLALLNPLGGASPASASSAGSTQFGIGVGVSVGPISVSTKPYTWVTYVKGSGLRVEEISSAVHSSTAFTGAGRVCNVRRDMQFYDSRGNRYWTVQGKGTNGCTSYLSLLAADKTRLNSTVKPGRVCITLYRDFTTKLASTCHSITR